MQIILKIILKYYFTFVYDMKNKHQNFFLTAANISSSLLIFIKLHELKIYKYKLKIK